MKKGLLNIIGTLVLIPMLWLTSPLKEMTVIASAPDEDGKVTAFKCTMAWVANDKDVSKRMLVCIPNDLLEQFKLSKCPDV